MMAGCVRWIAQMALLQQKRFHDQVVLRLEGAFPNPALPLMIRRQQPLFDRTFREYAVIQIA